MGIYLEEILIFAASLSRLGRLYYLAFYFSFFSKNETNRPTKNEQSRGLFVNPAHREEAKLSIRSVPDVPEPSVVGRRSAITLN